jgi:hypothetical protein
MTAPDAQAFSSTLILCINRNAYFSFLQEQIKGIIIIALPMPKIFDRPPFFIPGNFSSSSHAKTKTTVSILFLPDFRSAKTCLCYVCEYLWKSS